MINTEFYANNRKRFMDKMAPNSVAIIPSAPEATYSHDVHYPYRQNSYLRYLTGFIEPQSVLVIAPAQEHPFTLFVMPRDLKKEIWNGFRHGTEGATNTYKADQAYTIDELEFRLPEILKNTDHLYYNFGQTPHFDKMVFEAVNQVKGKIREGIKAPRTYYDPALILNEMRLFKQPYEIDMMQKAADISVEAHTEIMKQLKPGMHEYEMAAIIEYTFRKHNACMGYPAIVGGGVNATILHYIENDKELHDGDLLLTDAGAEYAYYNADITRTIPVNGRFSPTQKAVYEVVLEAQKQAINTVKPGNVWIDIHNKAVDVLTEGLMDLGLLKGSKAENIEAEAHTEFYMHKTGHWLGADVHDLGEYKTPEGEWRALEPGMVLTVEPGLYFGPHLKDKIPAEFHNIGIRIEDDILVTAEGHHNFTAGVPKEVSEIESLMA